MGEGVDTIRQRLELARELPESVDSKNTAANRWIEDVTLLLAENDRLQAVVEAAQGVLNTVEVSDHDSRGMPASAKVRYTRIAILERALAALDGAGGTGGIGRQGA